MLRNTPIRKKITFLIMFTSTAVLMLTFLTYSVYEYLSYHRSMEEHLITLGEIVAGNSSAAIQYIRPEVAEDLLSSLNKEEMIVMAALYNDKGQLFAYYPQNQDASLYPSAPKADGVYHTTAYYDLYTKVMEGDRRYGTLFLRMDIRLIYNRFLSYGLITITIMLCSLLLAYAISLFMQRYISAPILTLTETAKRISEQKDYSVRAEKVSRDEIGVLTDAFNYMLNQIHERDTALQESVRHFQDLANAMPQIVWTAQENGTVDYFNRRWYEYTGLTLDAALGWGWKKVLHPDDIELNVKTWEQALQKGETYRVECRYKRKSDNSYRWHLVRAIPIHDDRGRIAHWYGTGTDIQDLKEAQTAIAINEERLRIALDASRIGTWSWNIPENEMHWDDYVYPLFGFKANEISIETQEDFIQRIHPEDRDRVIHAVQDSIQQGKEYNIEFRTQWPDGKIHHLSTRGKVYFDTQGKPFRMSGASIDITDQKQAAETLAQHAKELARSNSELEQFAYVTSHDLQEPLRGIVGCLQLLTQRYQGKIDKTADEFISHAITSGIRLQVLIRDLLAYSRVSTRTKPFVRIAVGTIVEKAIENLKTTIDETQAIVHYNELPTIKADDTQLTQLFQNLIGNALKFHGEERPEITIASERRNGEWLFSVRDNGIGIDPQFFERVFVIFQRLHSRTSYPGTGIGLAICKKIIERHDGRIWIESEPRKGTVFYFTIPDR